MKASIIVPTYNEQKTISLILGKVLSSQLPKGIKKEIIVIDDGSSDGTVEVLKKYEKTIKLLKHNKNLGKGAAIKSGIKNSTGDIVIIQDADLEYDPIFLIQLLNPILSKKYKVVYGTRLKNYPLNFFGKNKTILPSHLIANRFLTAMTNFLYKGNLTDMETGYKLFDSKLLKSIKLNSERFDFEPEITAKILKKGIKILEIPIQVRPRSYKEGKKINWKDGLMAIWTLIKYKFIE